MSIFSIFFNPIYLTLNPSIFITLFYYLLVYQNFGIESVSIAYFTAFVVHLLLNYFYVKKGLSFKFMNNNLKSIIISSFIVLSILFISRYSVNWGYYLLPLALISWIILIISRNDYYQLKRIFIQYIRR